MGKNCNIAAGLRHGQFKSRRKPVAAVFAALAAGGRQRRRLSPQGEGFRPALTNFLEGKTVPAAGVKLLQAVQDRNGQAGQGRRLPGAGQTAAESLRQAALREKRAQQRALEPAQAAQGQICQSKTHFPAPGEIRLSVADQINRPHVHPRIAFKNDL